MRAELEALAFDPAAAARLAEAERAAEARWDELREEASRLRVAAAAASAEVAGLREQIAAAEQLAREIAAAEVSLREHAVAHSVLVEYRDAQTKRAWPALEQTAGALLAQATDGRYADVRFSGEDFRLVIVDRGEEHPFDRFSGGEQDLANLCVRLAIADWIARERDVELGFVVLDEVFGSQDDDRRRGLITQLRRLSERFHQMLVITHVPEIADQCDIGDRARAARAGLEPHRGLTCLRACRHEHRHQLARRVSSAGASRSSFSRPTHPTSSSSPAPRMRSEPSTPRSAAATSTTRRPSKRRSPAARSCCS